MNGKEIYSRQHGSPDEVTKKTGFKGNSENAKTRLCTRYCLKLKPRACI